MGQSGIEIPKYLELQKLIIQMIERAGSGHYASSMSALEIMYPLFYPSNAGRIKPEQFILSKGHAAPALYAILYDLGYIKDLAGFRSYNGLPGHPEIGDGILPRKDGVSCSAGSLGMGISKAVGLAKMNPEKTYHILVGDGELQEGQNWEALLYLTANNMKNVLVHVDCNGQQYSGRVGKRGDALLALLYTRGNRLMKGIRLYKTHWVRDNKFLTQPQMRQYSNKVEKYGRYLYNLVKRNEKVIVLDADLVDDFSLRPIIEDFPKRFVECGISEQHMVSMANGIALAGYYPVCHTFGAFYRRAVDQIYNNYHDGLNIVYTAGLVGKLPINIGVSHQAIRGREMLSWAPDILVTGIIEHLEQIGQRSIYFELGV